MRTKSGLVILLALTLTLPVSLMVACKSRQTRSARAGVVPPRPQGPCDIYAEGGTPCVAAHSTTRALSAAYRGPLYQVMRQSDHRVLDIGVVVPGPGDVGGYADAIAQDEFCADTLCVITVIYDQSGKENHLYQAPPGTFKGPDKGAFNTLPIADHAPITIRGHKAYGVYIMPGMGFRNNDAAGLPINDEPEGIYYVIDGTHYDSGCCFDYGNASANGRAVGTGTMETIYFGTATAWGSGEGPGPWIMADFEAGLFTGYNAKKNPGSPTIDSWRFVTAVVNAGGGNKWDLRGGNAQQGWLTTFYSGIRPGSSNKADYFPMHKKGAVLLGNGGDNGNGSSGTFYEGVMTVGYPTDAATDAVQANIVAANYDVPRLGMARVTTFTPGSSQETTVTFHNTTGKQVVGLKLSLATPPGWSAVAAGTTAAAQEFAGAIASGVGVSATFKITSPGVMNAGFLKATAEWTDSESDERRSEETLQRIRNAPAVKINEVRFSNGTNQTDQFIELFNASAAEVDLSHWRLVHQASQWASVPLAVIPAGTKMAPRSFYLLGLSSSGLATPTSAGATRIPVRSVSGFEAGQRIEIEGESRGIVSVGTAAAPKTTVFIPVSTGPWLTLPAGSTNLPVTSAAGFEVGQPIGIDLGGNLEIATVTAVGKAATQTTLSEATRAGATLIKVAANSDMSEGDTLTVDTGGRKERVTIKRIITSVAAPVGRAGFGGEPARRNSKPGELELAAPLRFNHMAEVDVSDVGAGISFTPATQFPHRSGESVQALGGGLLLEQSLARAHEFGAAVLNPQVTAAGYQGTPLPNQWFGVPLSTSAGSIALLNADGKVVVDAMVYGSRQSSSSANGAIASPELAILEGDQSQGGCIVVAPGGGRRSGPSNTSVGLDADGADTDNNCKDFQTMISTPGASNQNSGQSK